MTAYTQAERDEAAQQLRNYAPGGWSKNSALGRAADMLAAPSTSQADTTEIERLVELVKNQNAYMLVADNQLQKALAEIAALKAAPSTSQPRCCNHDSDCAVHNGDALPVGPCDCSALSDDQLHEGIKALLQCGSSDIDSLSPLMQETYTEEVRRVYVAMTNTLKAASSTSQPLVDKLTSIIQEHLTGLYVCGRVWDAWNIGTMSESDFTPAGETDFASDIADSLAAMLAAPSASPVTPWEDRFNNTSGLTKVECMDSEIRAWRMTDPSTSPTDAQLDELAHVAACYHDYSSLRERLAEVFKGCA